MEDVNRPYSIDTEIVSERAACVALRGEWDFANSAMLVEEVSTQVEQNRTAVAIDLQHVHYFDSSAMSALLQVQRQAESSGWHVVVVRPRDPRVWRLFELTGLANRFEFFDSRAGALTNIAMFGRGIFDD